MLGGRGIGVRFLARTREFCLLERAHPLLYLMGARGCLSGRVVKLTAHLQLVPRLRIHGAITTLPDTSSRRDA
jgi:hypothetical protein